MDRTRIIQVILKRVARKLSGTTLKTSIYRDKKGFLAESDMIAHRIFIKEIKKLYPEDEIFSEEDPPEKFKDSNISEYFWIVDPICGTTNYLYDIPLYSHALSLLKENEVIAAGVYDPSRDEMFFSDGVHFYVNGEKTERQNTIRLSEALISLNCNQSEAKGGETELNSLVKKLGPPVSRRVHILESANLELAYVASGRLDAYVNPMDNPWDFSAAKLFMDCTKGSYIILHNQSGHSLHQKGILAAGSADLLSEISEALN